MYFQYRLAKAVPNEVSDWYDGYYSSVLVYANDAIYKVYPLHHSSDSLFRHTKRPKRDL